MADLVGEAIVRVSADTDPAERAMARMQADFDRRMAAMDRARAVAEVDLSTKAFDREEAEIRARMKALGNLDAHPEIELDSDQAKAEIKWLEGKLSQIDKRKAHLRVDSSELKAANKQIDDTINRTKALEQLEDKRAAAAHKSAIQRQRDGRMEAQAHAENLRRTREVSVMEGKARAENMKRSREALQLETRARNENLKFDRERTRMAQNARRFGQEEVSRTLQNIHNVDKLRIAYAKAYGERTRLEKSARGRLGFPSADDIRAMKSASSEMDLLAHKIKSLGGSVNDIDPDIESHQGLLGRWASSLSSVRLQLGFFSATMRQLGIGLVALGPLFTALLGAATSMVGVLGTGLAGGLAVSTAALGGFLTSALGIGLVMKPAVEDISAALKASDALADAQLKYGKNSTEAKTAQEKLNTTLAGLDPVAKKAISSWGEMKDEWSELTKETKKPIMEGFASTIQTAKSLLPDFAKQTTATTRVASKAWQKWMQGLRSPEAKQALNAVMSNFRKSIPDIADGLGSLFASLGRIGASASKILPDMSNGFAKWADHIEDAVGSGDGLDKNIERMTNHFRDLGHFAQSGGSLLAHIFDTSADSGDDLLKTMTRVFDRWDAWAQSAGGKASLKSFFGEAAGETEQLGAALGHLTSFLFQVARATAPLSDGFMWAATAAGNIASLAASIAPLRPLLTGAGIFLGLKTMAKFLPGIGAGMKLLTASRGVTAAASMVEFGAGVGQAATKTSLLSRALTALGPLMASPLGIGAVSAVAIGALVAFSMSLGDIKTAYEEAGEAAIKASHHMDKATGEFVKGGAEYGEQLRTQAVANDDAASARERLVAVQKKYGVASKQSMRAVEELTQAEAGQAQAAYKGAQARAGQINAARQVLRSAKAEVAARQAQMHAAKEANQAIMRGEVDNTSMGNPNEAAQVANAVHKLSLARRDAAKAAGEMVVANIPLMRQSQDLLPLTEKNVTGLKKLSATIGATATKKIGSFTDPKDVGRITALSNKLTALGRGSQVKDITVKSRGADQTINKLQQLKKQTAAVTGRTATLNLKTNDRGVQQKLTTVSRMAQRIAGASPTLKILANAGSAEGAIRRLMALARAAASKTYKAELKAEDKSGAARSAFNHGMKRASTEKYEAKLTAINQAGKATSPAEAELKRAARGPYKATITAVNQTQPVVEQVISEINSISGRVHPAPVIVPVTYRATNSPPSGNYAGGPSAYVKSFAQGGDARQAMLDRAAEKAVVKPGGRSQMINKPTMLTGEEAPTHPEYVIATNPAYREANQRYIGQAARDMGMEVVPAYAKGKGDNKPKKNKYATPDRTTKQQAGAPPKELPSRITRYLNETKVNHGWGDGQKRGIPTFNRLEQEIAAETGHYQTEKDIEQRQIDRGTLKNWEYGKFITMRENIQADIKGINTKAIPDMLTIVGAEEGKAKDALEKKIRPRLGQINGQISHAKHALTAAKNDLTTLKPGKDGKEGKALREAKRAKEKEIRDLEKQKEAWEKQKEELKTAERGAKATIRAAKEERAKIKGEDVPRNQDAERAIASEIGELHDMENNVIDNGIEKPETPDIPTPKEYAEAQLAKAEYDKDPAAITAAKAAVLGAAENAYAAARATPDPRDDIETWGDLKSAQELVTGASGGGSGNPTPGEETASFNTAREQLYQQFASNISGGGAARGYMPGGLSAGASASNTPSTSGGSPATVNNVTNNFSAPPPDPHTWTKQQEFELGALT